MRNLKKLRKKKHLTQEHLAQLIGITKQMIWKYENDLKIPSLKRILQISKVLDCTLEELLDTEKES